jgi:hypothetical protein
MLVIKPHGCAGKLAYGNCNTFKITASELGAIGLNLQQHQVILLKHFTLQPLLTCGWSASEGYLLQWFDDLSKKLAIPATAPDPLGIIDICPDQVGHLKVIDAYKVKYDQAQIKVLRDQCYTTDDLFLWIQTVFGLNYLKRLYNAPNAELDNLLEKIVTPECNHWLNGWFDNFLPVWVRLCFNASVTQFFVNAAPMPSEVIPTDRRDEHIPWGYQEVLRPDLQMATLLLLQLAEDNIGERWDTGRFPGGLWDKENRRLILPLPCPQQNLPPSLAALKAMADSHHWEHKGDIMILDVLPLDQNGQITLAPAFSEALRLSVSKLMKHTHLADYRNIRIVAFSALKEATV